MARFSAQGCVKAALRQSFLQMCPDIDVDKKCYVGDFRDNLLPLVEPEDFEKDLRKGAGQELKRKFRAIHSSVALVVNCFAPFRNRIADLVLPAAEASGIRPTDGFRELEFERKCPTGLQGNPPHLKVVVSGSGRTVAVQGKLLGPLRRNYSKFKPAYKTGILDERREEPYFKEMLRLCDNPHAYTRLEAAQLIKHAFGLSKQFSARQVTLLYLYWEPTNVDRIPEFQEHRREVEEFGRRVQEATLQFKAMTYQELWQLWRTSESSTTWLGEHLDQLEKRYLVSI